MKLIVGLGNPGRIYADSRHNIGFCVIRQLSRLYKVTPKRDRFAPALSAKARAANQGVILAMPLTFMNLSGVAVKILLKKYRIELENLLVVCDDLDLEFGAMKIRPAGSSAGHNGVGSIINALESDKFPRLRIGIGRPPVGADPADYVLSGFKRREKEALAGVIEAVACCCQAWVRDGIEKTMNTFNQRRGNA